MNKLQKREQDYPVNLGENFIQEAIARHLGTIEPRRENNFLSNIFSRKTVNNFIRIRVYNGCVFHLNREED